MKIYISHTTDEITGYLNMRPTDDLSEINDSSAKEIVLHDALEHFEPNYVIDFLKHVIKKLRRGGKIIVHGIDTNIIARALTQHRIGIREFNELMYGTHSSKSCMLNTWSVQQVIKDAGLIIIQARIDSYYYSIIAERQANGNGQ